MHFRLRRLRRELARRPRSLHGGAVPGEVDFSRGIRWGALWIRSTGRVCAHSEDDDSSRCNKHPNDCL